MPTPFTPLRKKQGRSCFAFIQRSPPPRTIFEDVCKDFEAQLVEFDGESEHVHLLVNYPPKIAVSKLVNSLKGVSSRLIRKQHPELAKHYWQGGL